MTTTESQRSLSRSPHEPPSQPSVSTGFLSTKNLVLSAMFAGVLAIISQISIPMPTGVPITIQLFGITLVGTVLGWKLGLFSTLIYILIGAVGLPVFAGLQGGLGILFGMTGGYILAWPIMVILCGLKPKTSNKRLNLLLSILFSLIGLLIDEIAGGLQWYVLSNGGMTLQAIAVYSMIAFVPKDIAITVLATLIGRQIRKPLVKGGILMFH